MDTKTLILERLHEICTSLDLNDLGDIEWRDGQILRKCVIRSQQGDPAGWRDFMAHLRAHPDVSRGFVRLFIDLGWAASAMDADRRQLTLPRDFPPIDDDTQKELIEFLSSDLEVEDEKPKRKKLGVLMYIEEKPDLNGHARIGRVTFSATRKTIYYAGRKLRSLHGAGYKANYYDVDSGLRYWISNCKKGGNDTLYPGIVEIDENAREEYWTTIRKQPQNRHLTKFRSEGKYSRRRPA